jgi:hypothetical protein
MYLIMNIACTKDPELGWSFECECIERGRTAGVSGIWMEDQ